MINSRITDILNIKYPIIQGGMAWISDADLAVGVSEAGGLGIISGVGETEDVRSQIKKAKSLTNKPFGVNIMLMAKNVDEIAKMVCEEKVSVVTTGAGSPGKYMEDWKKNNIKVIPVVPSVAIAKRMEKFGADAVIVEGMEAGGHIGQLTTMSLVPQVVDAVSIPVIAAGGIGDGRGIAASFMLGACGVQMGTRFLVSDECNVHDNYKEKVLSARDIDSEITGTSTSHPVRVLRNKLTREYVKLEKSNADSSEIEALGKGALRKAVIDGDVENGSVMAGQIAGLVKEKQSCKEIINELVYEFEETLRRI
ncbi:enoyl-[acyl-carrier-protein] reductase FabK [Romboutsia ilealis]|uniref:Probable nitronate monooxygenase n=1 Tax=Romboutsia faecis TaxID=2764597 RepID=A0ABR7JNZ5_9FIRM|nr:enoyl-[acyl-carrier-protein] reductase FabK [Romboutsia faecis]MBC5996649.1 enoyl-[acyl-carrier-protein] reductase FabK [Romboutsia faecis]MRN24175.1 enoyl-[acyl-carrier-protein] reductase FabK [Romboutsia ilealis]